MKFISQILSILILIDRFLDLSCLNFHYGRQGTKHAYFERFNNTCGGPNQPVKFVYTGMRAEGNKLILNSTTTVKEDIPKIPKLLISIERCKNKENLDSCEHFYDYKIDNFCWLVNTYSPLWGPFFETYEPKYPCPIKKGLYKSTNGTVDTSALLLFPLDAYYWKVKVENVEKDTNRVIMCILVEARIITK